MKLPFVKIWAEGWRRLAARVRQLGVGRLALLAVLASLVAHIGIGPDGPIWAHEALNYDDPQVLAAIEESSVVDIVTGPTYFAYKPVYFLSLKVDQVLGGLGGPGGVVAFAHVVNWLLHALLVWVLVVLLAHALGDAWIAFAAGLLFAVHPVHVESVAWLSERKDVLSLLLALWAHLSYRLRRERGATRFVVPAVWLLLAGLTKGTVWSYAGVIVLDGVLHQRALGAWRMGAVLRRTAPVLVVALAGVVLDITVGMQAGPGGVEHAADTTTLVGTMAGVHADYLRHVVLPVGLALDYAIDPASGWSGMSWLGLLLAGAWLALLVVSLRKGWTLGVLAAGLWLFGLAPVNNIWPRTTTLIADRYLHVPAIGVYLLLAYGMARLGASRRYALGAVAVLLGVLCILRTQDFANSEAAWSATIDAVPGSALAHIQRGQDRARREHYAEAKTDALRAIELGPRAELRVRAHLVKCAALLGLGEPKKLRYEAQHVLELIDALPETELVARERPGVIAEAETFLGNALQAMGYRVAALEAFERAVLADAKSGVAQYNFATALAGLPDGRSLREARDRLLIALPLVERDATMHKQALIQLIAVQGRLGDAKAALATLKRAARRYRNDPDLFYTEARIRIGMGEIPRAKELLATIRHYDPTHEKGSRLQAEILVAEGQLFLRKYKDDRKAEFLKRAVHKFDEAVKSDPDYWQADVAAGDAFMERGLFSEARGRYRRALRIDERLGWVRALIARTHVIDAAWTDKFTAVSVEPEARPAVERRAADIFAGALSLHAPRIDFGFTALGAEQALLRDVALVMEESKGATVRFASAVLRAAAHLCAGGDLEMAEALLDPTAAALTDEPGHDTIRAGVLLLRAMVNQQKTAIAAARSDYEALSKKRPDDALPKLRLAEIDLLVAGARYKTAQGYREDKAGLRRAKTQLDRSLTALISFADDHPGSLEGGLAAASAEMSRNDWTAATRRLNQLSERFPGNPDVYRGRSTVYLNQRVQTSDQAWIQQLTQSADRELQKAISLDPRNVRAHLDASSLARSAQDLAMAVKHARRARQLEAVPQGPASRVLAGLLTAIARKAIEAREIQKAKRLIEESRKVDPHGAAPWVLEAELELATPGRTRLVDALAHARKAKELAPLDLEVNRTLAKIYREMGIIADTRRATLREPPNPMKAVNGEGMDPNWRLLTREEQGKRIKAWDTARKAHRDEKARLYARAVSNLELALSLDPDAQEADETKSRLHRLQQRDPLRRQKDQQRAMNELYPDAMRRMRTHPAEAYDLLLKAVALYPRFARAHVKIAEVVARHLLKRYRWDDPEERLLLDAYIGGAFMSVHMLDQIDGADQYIERYFFRGKLNAYLFGKEGDDAAKAGARTALSRYVDLVGIWVEAELAKPADERRPSLLTARRQFRDVARVTLEALK